MLITVYVLMHELGILDQVPKFRTAKPNSDLGKNVKASINSPLYRRGQCSQSIVNIKARWTNSHQHWQHVSSSTSTFINTSARE